MRPFLEVSRCTHWSGSESTIPPCGVTGDRRRHQKSQQHRRWPLVTLMWKETRDPNGCTCISQCDHLYRLLFYHRVCPTFEIIRIKYFKVNMPFSTCCVSSPCCHQTACKPTQNPKTCLSAQNWFFKSAGYVFINQTQIYLCWYFSLESWVVGMIQYRELVFWMPKPLNFVAEDFLWLDF